MNDKLRLYRWIWIVVLRIYSRLFTASLLALAFILLSSCSSSDSGPPLPGVAVDEILPEVLDVLPDITDEVVDPLARITLSFTERMNQDSYDESENLYSLNSRDINETVISNDNVVGVIELDKRNDVFNSNFRTVLATIQEKNEENEFITKEREVTQVEFVPGPRFALNTRYKIVLDRNLKDLSENETLHPLEARPTTGNFIERDVVVDFEIQDGEWKLAQKFDANNTEPGLRRTSPNYYSSPLYSAFYRIQADDTAGGRKRLMVAAFDDVNARVDNTTLANNNFDSLPNDPVSTDALGDAISYEVHGSEDALCVTWLQEVTTAGPVPNDKIRIFARCRSDSDWSEKTTVVDDINIGEAYSDLQIVVLNSSVLIGYIHEGTLKLVAYEFEGNSLNAVDATTLNWTNVSASEFNLSVLSETQVSLLYYTHDVVAPTLAHSLHSTEFLLGNGGFAIGVSAIVDSSNAPYSDIEQSFDVRGFGFAMWINEVGVDAKAQVARFNGVAWENPTTLPQDTRGGVLEVALHTFWEGHSIFSWIQDIGVEQQVRVTGHFPIENGASYIRPLMLVLNQANEPITQLDVTGDFEGNGMLSMIVNSSAVVTARFSDNSAWDFAWEDTETILSGSGVIEANFAPISDDGRIVASILRTGASQPEIFTALFSE